MNKYFILITISFIYINNIIYAEFQPDTTVKKIRKYGISIKAGGIIGGSIAFDAFIAPKINTEININYYIIIYGAGTGFYYHFKEFNNCRNWSPYIGIHEDFYIIDIFEKSEIFSSYIPIGIQYFGKKGFSCAADIGCSYMIVFQYDRYIFPMGSIKLGYRF